MSDSIKSYEEAVIKELNQLQEKFAGQPRVMCATSVGDDVFDFSKVTKDDIVFGVHGSSYIVAKARHIKTEEVRKCYLKYVNKYATLLQMSDDAINDFWKLKTTHKDRTVKLVQNPNFNEPSMYPHGKFINNFSGKSYSEAGKRYNTGKIRWSLVSWKALEPMVKVLMFGANKYDDHNWKKGLKYSEVTESLQRHITAFIEGEDNDPESKLSHVGHILCNAMFLSYMYLFRKDMDDRYRDPNFEKCCGNWDEKGICKCKN